jgi:hypothetical protein
MCRTKIRCPRLLIDLVSGDPARGIDEDVESAPRFSLGVLDIALSTYVVVCLSGVVLRH